MEYRTKDKVLHYLLRRGEPDIVPNIAAGIGVSHSAVRTAIMRQKDYTFVEAGRVPGKRVDARWNVLWAAWEW